MRKVVLLNQGTYRELQKRLIEGLQAKGVPFSYLEDPREIPGLSDCVVSFGTVFPGIDSHPYTFLNASHGGMWGKSGAEVFSEYQLKNMHYCVSSNWEVGLLKRKGILPLLRDFRVTGRIELDILHGLEQDRRGPFTVLYAPTWNTEFTGGNRKIMQTIRELGRLKEKFGYNLEVAIHPLTEASLPFSEICSLADRVRMEKEDFFPFLSRASILVGDYSSNMLQFLATGRPIIAYNSFAWWENQETFDPPSFIFRMRDSVYQYSGEWGLEACLRSALSEPRDVEYCRQAMADELLGGTYDGKCTERIIRYLGYCMEVQA